MSGMNSDSSFDIEGRAGRTTRILARTKKSASSRRIIFVSLETPLLQGRFFTAADKADAPQVVIINQALGETLLA